MSLDFACGVLRTRLSFGFGVWTGGESWDRGPVREGRVGDLGFDVDVGVGVGVGSGSGSVPFPFGIDAAVLTG